MLLQSLSGDIKGQIIGVNNASNKLQVGWHHVLKVIGDEHPSDVQLDQFISVAILLEVFTGLTDRHEQK